jgi:hypothetical protein
VDLNKDGAPEIITSTKRGTFIFWNSWKKTGQPTNGPPREIGGSVPAHFFSNTE